MLKEIQCAAWASFLTSPAPSESIWTPRAEKHNIAPAPYATRRTDTNTASPTASSAIGTRLNYCRVMLQRESRFGSDSCWVLNSLTHNVNSSNQVDRIILTLTVLLWLLKKLTSKTAIASSGTAQLAELQTLKTTVRTLRSKPITEIWRVTNCSIV